MIYLNGKLLPPAAARIDPSDRGFTLGDGVFETLRAHGGKIACLVAHLDRLRNAAETLRIPLPITTEEMAAALDETLAANGLGGGDAALRVTLTRGPGPRGIQPPENPSPTLMITAAPAAEARRRGIHASLVEVRRNEHSPLARLKTLNYLENILARQEVDSRGAEEALLRNLAGNLAEASAANLFLVIDGIACTPPLADGPLPGITRALVLARHLPAVERTLSPEDIGKAEEAFLTNSLIGVQPLIAVDDNTIGDGKIGPVTRHFQTAYLDEVAGG